MVREAGDGSRPANRTCTPQGRANVRPVLAGYVVEDGFVRAPSKTRPGNVSGMSRATILIADDDVVMRTLLQHHLQQAGYVVLSTINGAEAVERSQAQPVDLVITDLYMPFLNGLEVCQQL